MVDHAGVSTASPQRLWEVISDLPHWADMLSTVDSSNHESGPVPPQIGSRFRLQQPGLPPAVYEVTRWEPGVGFTWDARGRGLIGTATHDVAPGIEGGSHLSLTYTWAGPLALVARILGSRKGRQFLEIEVAEFARMAERT